MKTDELLYHVRDDTDVTVATYTDGEDAYKEAHRLANREDRVYRVVSERTVRTTRVRALAVPISWR